MVKQGTCKLPVGLVSPFALISKPPRSRDMTVFCFCEGIGTGTVVFRDESNGSSGLS